MELIQLTVGEMKAKYKAANQ